MMITVAIAGVGLGSHRMHARRLRFLDQARSHAESEAHCAFMWSEVSAYPDFRWPGDRRPPRPPEKVRSEQAAARSYYERKIAHHVTMRAKYERAARYPWLPVAPDSREPK